jgi:transcriptional regulator with XRE-family HTH domain
LIRQKRLHLRLSQEALAEKAEVHATYVGMVERGERTPTLDVASRLASAAGSSLGVLIAEIEKDSSAQR